MSLVFEFHVTSKQDPVQKSLYKVGEQFDLVIDIINKGRGSFKHKGIFFDFNSLILNNKSRKIPLTNNEVRQLSGAGSIDTKVSFEVKDLSFPEDIQSYSGDIFSVKHLLHINIKKTFSSTDYTEELKAYNIVDSSLFKDVRSSTIRVLIENCIKLDICLNRTTFNLNDIVIGSLQFLIVDISIMKIFVDLFVLEVYEPNNFAVKNERLIKRWQITDGAPTYDTNVPFRLYLAPLNLSPACLHMTPAFSVSYFLKFEICVSSGAKYFKKVQLSISRWDVPPMKFVTPS